MCYEHWKGECCMDSTKGNILIYQNENGDTKVDAYFDDSTIWMSQRSIADL